MLSKKGEDKVQLARTAQDALKEVALPVDLAHVGIGTSHTFTAKNANTKVLVAIDNYLQSPIAGTSVTTTLDRTLTNLKMLYSLLVLHHSLVRIIFV